jgi:hypothetical protein
MGDALGAESQWEKARQNKTLPQIAAHHFDSVMTEMAIQEP